MYETRIPVKDGDLLTFNKAAGDLAVSGSSDSDILIRLEGSEEELQIEETETGPVVSTRKSCEVVIPSAMPVTIRQASGNLVVKNLDATLSAEQVRGNLVLASVKEATLAEVYGNLKADALSSLRMVGTIYGDAGIGATQSVALQNVRGNLLTTGAGQLRVSRVGGNLQARGIEGTLDADQIGGNALLKDIHRATTLNRVAGNLIAKNLCGGAKATRIGGNLVLNGELGSGYSYHFVADGNAMLRLTEETSVYLSLTAKGHTMVSLPIEDQQRKGNTLTGTLGDGGAEMVIEAKGNVMVGAGGAAFGAGLGEEISRQLEESLQAIDLEAIGRQVSEEMESALSRLRVKLESVDWERVGMEARRGVERAMDRMQQDMDRMTEKAARHQKRLERKAEQQTRRVERMERKLDRATRHLNEEGEVEVPRTFSKGSVEPSEPEPDFEDERMSILRMVEQGQITPADAEMLLDALA